MIYVLLAAAVFLLDFAIKSYVDKKYARKVRHPKLNGTIVIEKYYTKGAVLNFLEKSPGVMQALHTAVMAVAGGLAVLLSKCRGKKLCKTGLAMLFGGGLSNLYDRYTKGHVVDYFHINIGPKWLRNVIFNLSDFFIFIGVILAAVGSEKE